MNPDDGIERFVIAQQNVYHRALYEIKNGSKQSHWMWFIFPQIRGLGFTDYNQYYGIKDLKEAEQYLNDPILGKRLIEISEAVLSQQGKTALEIFGKPDDRKLKSCMTLFNQIENTNPIFLRVLDKYYLGLMDDKTVSVLRSQENK
ncbi:DUF1810 domain-containing protein [Flavobacterium sp. WLB]|uniref:DUF1810 domain-containing protein n=1 Tax=unclassified Flavobacterium TaxID=196869 RepID=UPI0006ABABA6|nr:MULTISPECIES: DUF1810 domain-containing protein [unclassified Flavobacterium]KOP38844.1 hypothetical protein AKO67_07390 [Flavobacterium sp. VMW]OWU92790.1 hypothetical protein APR43_01655 [Flavobacterium sp. NLM]PUU71908.1 DUF1810 domain-containing protein [Flavobacterium sp. WLB]